MNYFHVAEVRPQLMLLLSHTPLDCIWINLEDVWLAVRAVFAVL